MDDSQKTDPTASTNPAEPDGWARAAEEVDRYVDDLTEVRFAAEQTALMAEKKAVAEFAAAETAAAGWWARLRRWTKGFLRGKPEQEFDALYEQVVAAADHADALVDQLMDLGHRKKNEIQDQMAALTREMGRLNSETDRVLALGEQSQALQQAIRSVARS
jgi:hypothetical protein